MSRRSVSPPPTRWAAVFLLALLATVLGGVVAAPHAPAAPGESCSVSTLAELQRFKQEAEALGGKIDAHNARHGSVDNRNAAAVADYNAEAAQLNAQSASLKAVAPGLLVKAKTCQLSVPNVPEASQPAPRASANPNAQTQSPVQAHRPRMRLPSRQRR